MLNRCLEGKHHLKSSELYKIDIQIQKLYDQHYQSTLEYINEAFLCLRMLAGKASISRLQLDYARAISKTGIFLFALKVGTTRSALKVVNCVGLSVP